jgi:hypothetical protein
LTHLGDGFFRNGDSDGFSMMGTIMMVLVLMGMGLSVFQLIAELIARGRYAEFLAGRDEAIRELYPAPQQASAAA